MGLAKSGLWKNATFAECANFQNRPSNDTHLIFGAVSTVPILRCHCLSCTHGEFGSLRDHAETKPSGTKALDISEGRHMFHFVIGVVSTEQFKSGMSVSFYGHRCFTLSPKSVFMFRNELFSPRRLVLHSASFLWFFQSIPGSFHPSITAFACDGATSVMIVPNEAATVVAKKCNTAALKVSAQSGHGVDAAFTELLKISSRKIVKKNRFDGGIVRADRGVLGQIRSGGFPWTISNLELPQSGIPLFRFSLRLLMPYR